MKKGFSIVEVLVAISISSVVGVAMWALIENALVSSGYYLDRQEFDEAIRQVQFLLMRTEQCASALGSNDDDPATNTVHAPVAFVPNGAGVYQANVFAIFSKNTDATNAVFSTKLVQSNQPYGRVKIGQISLQETVEATSRGTEVIYNGTTPVTYNTFLVSLVVPASTRSDRLFEPRPMPFKIYVNPANNNIEKCYLSFDDNQTCGSFGGQFNPASGKCEMTECNATSGALRVPCQTPGSPNCTKQIYFWGFESDGTTTTPVCICQQSCLPPPPPPPTPSPY